MGQRREILMMTQDTAAATAPRRQPETLWNADVLIIGGGLVGGTLAAALAHFGLTSVVVEASRPAALLEARFDGRASAISLTSRRLLEAVGLWQWVADEAAPMLDIRVSDGASPLFLHFAHGEVGDEPFGHMLENRYLRRAIFHRLGQLPEVTLLAPARIARLERGEAAVDGALAGGGMVRAQLAVACDGRASPTREEAGIRVTGWRYGQTAIVCTVDHEKPHHAVAHEHFLPSGPFAILPLKGNRSSIVWTEREALVPSIMALDDAGFAEELGRRFGTFLGAITPIGPRWAYPLSLQYAETVVGRRLALAGDSAHGMHPIAGQGLNMGLRDVAALADVLADAKTAGRDFGERRVLARYEGWRRFDNAMMLAATDGLNRLFSNDIAPVRLARDVGLAAVNRIPALKRLFMRHAMGMLGDLPTLMRG
jgi:2-octaprenyl-6-methoxyphenol hydroxylase